MPLRVYEYAISFAAEAPSEIDYVHAIIAYVNGTLTQYILMIRTTQRGPHSSIAGSTTR